MYLQKIEIYGFKSFAEKTVIKFKNGITAIVGPNGSGKSNIVDAVRWVLGEQSMKSLRGKKSEDIIFNGTQFRKKLGYAEVSIFFSNEDNFFNIDFKEIKITRKLYRSGESEYLINDSSVKLKDIRELLMGTGIGRDGYSIIGQGKIDEILSASSEDRKRIFEEAAGIVKYKYKKQEAEKNLENTENNLIRIRDILYEINSGIDLLEEKSIKAKKYLNLSRELEEIETKIFLKSLNKIKKEKERCLETEKTYSTSIESLNEEKENLLKRKEEIVLEKENLKKELEEFNVYSENKIKENAEINKEIYINKQNIENNNKDILILEEEIKEDEKSLKEKTIEYQEKYNKYTKYLEESKVFEKKYLEKQEILNKKTKEISESEKELLEYKEKIDKNIDEIYTLENEILVLDTNKEYEIKEQEKNKDKESDIISKLDAKKIELQEFISSNRKIAIKREEENKKLEILNNKVEEAKKNIEKNETEKKELITMNSALNGRLNVLEVMEEQNESFSLAIKKILAETKKNNEFKTLVKGIVAKILKVDSKYSLAIENALGYSIQNIVVEKKEDANKIISFLKENNLGRATFLPLDSINPVKVNKNIKLDKGIIGFAVDLISYDNYYRNIVEYLLGKVIIAEDLNSGIAFSKKEGRNFKIVTLDGDLINPSGAITGGSVNKNRVGVLSRKEDIKKLKKQIESQEKRIKEIEENLIKEEKNLLNVRTLRSNYYKTYNKSSVEFAIYEEKQNKIEKDIKNFEIEFENIKKNKEEIKNTIIKIDEDKKQKASLKEKKETETEEYKAYLKQRENTEEKEKLNELQDEVTNLKISYSSFKDSVDSSFELANIIKEQIDKDVLLKEKKEENIKTKKEEIERYTLNVKNAEENLKESILIDEKNKDRVSEINKELDLKEKITKENLEAISQNEKQTQDIEMKQNKLSYEIQKLEFERENIIENMWENYEITLNSDINISEEEYEKIDLKESEKRIKILKKDIREIGSVDISSIDEFIQTKKRKEFIEKQEKDIVSSINEIKNAIKELNIAMEEEFAKKFKEIKENFEEVFIQFFGGGKATLELENEDNLLYSDIEIKAQPPGKKLQSMILLSGGERTLTAIALLFAILKTNPSPICMLDEIEAALDDINIERFTNYLTSYANKNIQFIIITHRKGTMEAAESIYGATMEEKGITKLISLDLKTN